MTCATFVAVKTQKTVTVRIPADLMQKIRLIARAEGRTVQGLLSIIVRDSLADMLGEWRPRNGPAAYWVKENNANHIERTAGR